MNCVKQLFSQIVIPIRNQLAIAKVYLSTSYVGVLGVPFSKGQPKKGVELAPDALRNFGLIKEIQELGLDVKDYGNIQFEGNIIDPPVTGKLKFPLSVGSACQKVSNAVKTVLQDGKKCLTIGGDHSIGIGTVHGHSLVHDVCVLWVDAHADINTVETTRSGNLHGMPCSFLIKELQKCQSNAQGFEWLQPCINKSNLAFIGLRDIDPMEKLILSKENIVHFTMRDIDKLGIFEVIERALKAINPMGNLSLHVSFDIDCIDALTTPSTGTPVLGGLTIREAICLAEEVSRLETLRAIDIVEVNPILGTKEHIDNTLRVALLMVKTFLGYSRHGSLPMLKQNIPMM